MFDSCISFHFYGSRSNKTCHVFGNGFRLQSLGAFRTIAPTNQISEDHLQRERRQTFYRSPTNSYHNSGFLVVNTLSSFRQRFNPSRPQPNCHITKTYELRNAAGCGTECFRQTSRVRLVIYFISVSLAHCRESRTEFSLLSRWELLAASIAKAVLMSKN